MKSLKKFFAVILAVLALASLAVLNASADDSTTITATVGDSIDWRSYFTMPNGFTLWNPHVWDYDDAGYANMSNDYVIRCKKPGRAIFTAAFGDPLGGGYVCTLKIDIKPKDGNLLVFRTSRGEFSNGHNLITMTTGTAASISATLCPKISDTGYKLEGWNVDGKGYTSTIPVHAGGVTYLDAAWRPYTVSLNANGGTVNPVYVNAVSDQKLGEMPTPTRAGFLFDGWYTQQYGGAQWTADTVFPYAHDVTLYAHWISATTTITSVYISGIPSPKIGATVSTGGIKVSEGVTTEAGMYWSKKSPNGNYYQTTDTTFQEGGEYSFFVTLKAKSGYALSNPLKVYLNGTPAEATRQTPVAYTVSCKFPALPKHVTVYLNPAGGVLNTTSKSVMSNGTYGELPTPVRPGHLFLGWYAASSDGGVRITAGDNVLNAVDHTLTAQWAVDPSVGKLHDMAASNRTLLYKKTENMLVYVNADSNASVTLSYSGYDADVISISDSGVIYGKKVGSTEVTVKAVDTAGNTLTDTCTVTVKYAWWQQLIRIFLLGFLWY